MRTKLVKITLAVGLCACLISLSSCAAGKVSQISGMEPAEYIRGNAVIHYPMIAKMKIAPKKISYAYLYQGKCKVITDCEMLAYYDTLKKIKIGESYIDGIINPIYDFSEGGFSEIMGLYTTITVTGYAYVYTEFREITKEDKDLLAIPVNTNTGIRVQTTNTAGTNVKIPEQIDNSFH